MDVIKNIYILILFIQTNSKNLKTSSETIWLAKKVFGIADSNVVISKLLNVIVLTVWTMSDNVENVVNASNAFDHLHIKNLLNKAKIHQIINKLLLYLCNYSLLNYKE